MRCHCWCCLSQFLSLFLFLFLLLLLLLPLLLTVLSLLDAAPRRLHPLRTMLHAQAEDPRPSRSRSRSRTASGCETAPVEDEEGRPGTVEQASKARRVMRGRPARRAVAGRSDGQTDGHIADTWQSFALLITARTTFEGLRAMLYIECIWRSGAFWLSPWLPRGRSRTFPKSIVAP